RGVAIVLIWATLIFLIPLAPVVGSAASIIASLLALLLTPFAFGQGGLRAIRAQPAMLAFILVFLALGVAFLITARTPRDPIYVLNFLSLPLAALLYLVLRRRPPGPDPLPILAWLCLAACLVATLVAFNDIFIRDLPRVRGFNLGPHVMARIVLVFGFAALTVVLGSSSRWRLIAYAAPALALAVLYLSGTRGAMVALPPMGAVYVAFLLLRREDRWQALALAAAGA
ncbi:unnamed protein product, partial [Laminaria digitata]